MHFTDIIYRNPYWPTFPLIQITQGCTHNSCKFCTMYRNVGFMPHPMEWIEEDLAELASVAPDARTIQILSANPLVMTYNKLVPILEKINEYLPNLKYLYTQARITDFKYKTVEELKELKKLGIREISLGVESGDDWTLERINKGYSSQDILEQCAKLDEAGIKYWMTFLNGVAGKEHSIDHARNSALIFNQCNPMLVGIGGLTLFPGTPFLEESERGLFDPLTEREMIVELKTFLEILELNCSLNTHHTISTNLTGPDFLSRKDEILKSLEHEIEFGDMKRYARDRKYKRTL